MENEALLIGTPGSVEETKHLARELAVCLEAGDVLLLSGDLGAGKTHFTQGLAAGLGADEPVISPTFNIVLTYRSGRLPLHHFDLYRLERAEQLEDIGLREYLESDGVCVVEWAEKFPEAFDEFLALEMRKTSETGRALYVQAEGDRARQLLSAWRERLDADEVRSLDAEDASGAVMPDAPEATRVVAVPRVDAAGSGAVVHNSENTWVPASGTLTVSDPASRSVSGARFVLAFDTANEVVAVAIGRLDAACRTIEPVAVREVEAHRASNTTLVPLVDELARACGIARKDITCVCVGRGPGSFTGVRIAMAAAKGAAQALGVGLVGVSTLDAIAWNIQADGLRGDLLVIADAMRKEVYPVRYRVTDAGAERLENDHVIKADAFAAELGDSCARGGGDGPIMIAGDGLVKYRALFEPQGKVLDERLWPVSGRGLLLALEHAWQSGEADPLDARRHDPAFALPVYTRLSDAEENERIKLAKTAEQPKNLRTGVQDVAPAAQTAPDGGIGRATMHSESVLVAPAGANGVSYRPLDAAHAADVAALERIAMGSDAWNEGLVADELGQRNRSWWIAEADGTASAGHGDANDALASKELVGYAGGLVIDGDVQILKVAVSPSWRRRGIARELIVHVAEDARNLGAQTCSLEVRASNGGAQAFYGSLGLVRIGERPRYYSDGEAAVIMQGPLPAASRDVAGMELQHHDETLGRHAHGKRPLILAIESSCDETAAAVADGEGKLLSDVVASQIDFHSRFGGVVPEIASRKHIEAICGVCAEALETAHVEALPGEGGGASPSGLKWADLDAIAVTYAPGLLGALVVGVAYAKAAAWALDIPFICVNHLEGHLYANKIGDPGFAPPAVVSLVSGGNTMLVHMRGWGDYVTLGATIDDAVGEAFDKVAKALGLGYPGGPVISRYAAQGNPDAIPFPRAMLHSHDLRFSLSGLKTAVVTYINNERSAGRELNVADVAASFQQAVVDVQVAKAKAALQQTGARTFCLGGGVAANPVLRSAYEELCAKMHVKLVMPPLSSCGDNAGMIALVALDRYGQRKFCDLSADAQAHASLDEPY